MHTTATLHVHPAAATYHLIFEIRRLARESGCSFATTKQKQQTRTPHTRFDPNGGGHAA